MSECARCHRKNPIAPAHVITHGVQGFYCHGDATSTPTCYTLSSWDGYPELRAAESRMEP